MPKAYRVVVSENQKLYPNMRFIDFAPASVGNDNYSSHEIILKMRQRIYPEVENLTDGLLLYDLGNKEYRFKMELVGNNRLREYQKNIVARFSKDIIEAYENMRASGREETLKVDNYNMAEIFDFYSHSSPDVPVSAKESDLSEKSKYYLDLDERRKDLLRRRQEKYDSMPVRENINLKDILGTKER